MNCISLIYNSNNFSLDLRLFQEDQVYQVIHPALIHP